MVEWFRALVSQSGGPGFKASTLSLAGPGAGVLPYLVYIGMCGPKRCGFQPFWS